MTIFLSALLLPLNICILIFSRDFPKCKLTSTKLFSSTFVKISHKSSDSDKDHIKESADNPTIGLNSFQLVRRGKKEKSFLFVAFHITLAGFTTYLDKSR